LPSLQQPNDFLYVINHVFYLKSDHHWVERIDKDLWKNFFELLGIQINLTNPVILRQLNQAIANSFLSGNNSRIGTGDN
jgi:hypothetical protein